MHHYIGGAKARYQKCGPAVDYTDEAYYFTLDALAAYQKDIDLHRDYIARHTSPKWRTTISFDEWGLWHPEATHENGIRQRQTMRDALFAAGALHIFYRNCAIVEYAMETQMSNLLQSLFETDGPRFYRTPTFYVMRLFQDRSQLLMTSCQRPRKRCASGSYLSRHAPREGPTFSQKNCRQCTWRELERPANWEISPW